MINKDRLPSAWEWALLLASLAIGIAALGALFGCSTIKSPTQPPAQTQAQVLAIEYGYTLAARKGVRLDAIIFTDPPNPAFGAWAVCNEYVIGVNKDYIEYSHIRSFIPAIMAHEVCHIYYKDNLPCLFSPKVDIEARAESCAKELL